MSVADRSVPLAPLAPLDTWLPGLDRAAVAELVGSEACAKEAQRGIRIQGQPTALADRAVQAHLTDARAGTHLASVGLGTAGALACHCDCSAFAAHPPCPHIGGLLLALADSKEMRAALAPVAAAQRAAHSEDVLAPEQRGQAAAILRQHGIDLEDGRRRASEPRTGLLELTLPAWQRRGALRPLGPTRFMVSVEPCDDAVLGGGARLRVRVCPSGDRKPLSPDDLESRRLPAHEWRLLEPLAGARGGAPEFVVSSGAAATFLDRAHEAGATLLDDETGRVLRFASGEARLALRLRPSRPSDVSEHPIVAARRAEAQAFDDEVHEAWLEFSDRVAAVGEQRFRSWLGLPSRASEADERDAEPPLVLEAQCVPAAAGDPRAAGDLPEQEALEGVSLFLGSRSWLYLPSAEVFARVSGELGPIALTRLTAQSSVLVEPDEVQKLPALLHEHFRGEGVLLPTRAELGLAPLPTPHIVLRVSGGPFAVEAILEAGYGSEVHQLGPGACAELGDGSRNREAEHAAVDVLGATVLEPHAPRGSLRRRRPEAGEGADAPTYRAEGDAAVTFWTRDLGRLMEETRGGALSEVVAPADLRQLKARGAVRSRIAAYDEGDLLHVSLRLAADGVPAAIAEIRAALEARRRWVRLTDGSVAELTGRIAALVGQAGEAFEDDREEIVLPRHAIGEAQALSELADEVELPAQLASWHERLHDLFASGAEPEPVRELQARLRGYQRTGLAWLQLLADLGLGGILADDMGLGKTVQALALLAWRRERDGTSPTLVVAPTSVAPSWVREAERFTPQLGSLLLHGTGRHARYDDVPRSDLVITTYALLRRDVERLRGVPFRYVILDEAQHIKNHAAATTSAAKSLTAEARLALTGTPIENRLLELWSILDFCNPGMLGTWRSFARRYERPVSDEVAHAADAGAPSTRHANVGTAALRARIRPVVLRRTKAEVERDLPPKIETDVVVELTAAQRRAYAALSQAVREDVGRRISSDGLQRSRMMILTALLRLRQMACDPRLIDPAYTAEDSAKLAAFRELVDEIVASGRRALVFSQFVELLTLVRSDLDQRGIAYSYLDGRSTDRAAIVDGFVTGSMPLFLLSLRAGGVGLNLAAADVVIHFDPWWNPAVEQQATDRAHRIGQTKAVSVYRLTAAGTIEEAILRMKERKRALADAVLDSDVAAVGQLTPEEIDELLQFSG